MRKILSLLFLLATFAVAEAQNRMVVMPKTGTPQGYDISNVDSIFFDQMSDGIVATPVINRVSTSAQGDTLWVAVTPSEGCARYRITVMPKVTANAITSPASLDAYFNQMNADYYSQPFTNAEMTGFETPFQPATDYTLITLAYDKYNTPCNIGRADFTTPSASIVGNPSVSCVVTDAQAQTIDLKFTPNSDCSGYYFCLFKEGEAESQFNQWAPMFGFANMGDMIKMWGIAQKTEYEYQYTALTPGTNYDIYVLPLDANGANGTMIVAKAATKKLGGTGVATVTITVGDFKQTDGGSYQEVTYTPNDQASLHRDMLIDADTLAVWGDAKAIAYLQQDNPYDPYWNQYGVDVAQWQADPSTKYVALSIAQNINGEWGPLAKQEFTTPAVGSKAPRHAAKAAAVRKVVPKGSALLGRIPAGISVKGNRLTIKE